MPADLSDGHFQTTCSCGQRQTPLEAPTEDERDGDRLTYRCLSCSNPLVYVDRKVDGDKAIENSGFRIRDWVLRNRFEVIVIAPGWDKPVLLPATPALFE